MEGRLVLLWKGNENGRRLIRSFESYPITSLLATKIGLEKYGAEIVGACKANAVPPQAVQWRLGDPGSEYFYGQQFRGDLKALLAATDQARREGLTIVPR